MNRFIHEQVKPAPEKYEAIKCFTHGVFIWSKTEVKKSHKGCEVHYVKADGTIDD